MTTDPLAEGAALLDQNRPAEALACFETSSDPRAWFGRAAALHMLGRLAEAEAAYLRVLDAHVNEEALSNLVALAVESFDLERVERYARLLLNLNPESIAAWQALVVVAVERGDFAAAAESFARIDGRTILDDRAIQYRLSGDLADRLRNEFSKAPHSLKDQHGAVARSH